MQIKEPYGNSYIFFVSFQPGVYKVHLPIKLARGSGSIQRSACASKQSDQNLCYSFIEKYHIKPRYKGISLFQLVSIDEQVGLSLIWSDTRTQGPIPGQTPPQTPQKNQLREF